MNKEKLVQYAKLLVNVGINVRKNQDVQVNAELDQPEFVETVVEECYKAGARKVTVNWSHQPVSRINALYRSLETLSEVEPWELNKLDYTAETLPARLHIVSDAPDGMLGIDQEKMSAAGQARQKILKPYRDRLDNKQQWCIAAVPGKAWAAKVFPGLDAEKAVEKLWDAIIVASRAENDPVQAWIEHNANLRRRYEYLNSLGIRTLEYKSSNGTDFSVGLLESSLFHGGDCVTLGGNTFSPNIPSEELYVSPDKNSAQGIVHSTMPLSYSGEIIENFSIEFENGKAVGVHAEKNEELLKKLISMDEGAAFLGEVALVPYSSPIRKAGILFYNTLFDENASCHLALGAGFNETVKGYEKLTNDEIKKMGINDSAIHVDFMVGAPDMSITANTFDGRKIEIFVNGEWAGKLCD